MTENTQTRRGCEVEVFSRVTGFMRPVQAWNPGKKAEFAERKLYNIGGKHEDCEESTRQKGRVDVP